MGYRLGITNEDETIQFYGTKHYGYSFEIAKFGAERYPSVKYLIDLGKLDENAIFDYGFDNTLVLTAEEFEKFIKLYDLEYHRGNLLLLDENIKALLKDKGNKKLDWCW